MESKEYDKGVDYEFLHAMGVEIIEHQPWQLGLFHEDLEGKFLWYPQVGTLMYEGISETGSTIRYRVREKGEFKAEDPDNTEKVYNEIIDKIKDQQPI